MLVESNEGKGFENSFERELYQTLCRELNQRPEPYTVLGPMWIKSGREIDGLLITPYCVFTLEAKNFNGRVQKEHLNAPFLAFNEYGSEIDLSDRHQDPYQQAASQWFGVRDALTYSFGEHRVLVKSLLVLPAGTALDVAPELRDPGLIQIPAYILTADEVATFAANFFSPSNWVGLNAQTQHIITKSITGLGKITSIEQKQAVAAITGPVSKAAVVSTTTSTERVATPFATSEQPTAPIPAVTTRPPGPAATPTTEASGGFLRAVARLISIGLLAALAYFSLNLLLTPLISGGVALLIFVLFLSRHAGVAIYTYLGGLIFAFVSKILALSMLISTLAAIFWPLSILLGGFLWLSGDLPALTNDIPFIHDLVPTSMPQAAQPTVPIASTTPPPTLQNSSMPDVVEVTPKVQGTPTVEETPIAEETPIQSASKNILVQENSNVRAGPSTADPIIGIALDGQIFVVLEVTAAGNWYKIELEAGKLGWIGSSRVQEIDP